MKKWRLLALLASLLVLAACGGQLSGGGNGNGGGGNGSLSATQALGTYAVVQTRMVGPLAATGLAPAAPPFLVYLGALNPYTPGFNLDNCNITTSGSLADSDGDYVPENATFNGSCAWQISVEGKDVHFTWSFDNFNIKDPNDTNPKAGYQASGKMSWRLQVGSDIDQTMSLDITHHDLVWQSAQQLYTYDYTGTLSWQEQDGTDHHDPYKLTGTWKPEDINEPWEYGWQVINAGSYFKDGEGEGNSWTLEHELDLETTAGNPLYFTKEGDNSGIKSGEMVAKFIDYSSTPSESCTVTFTWSDFSVGFALGDDCTGG